MLKKLCQKIEQNVKMHISRRHSRRARRRFGGFAFALIGILLAAFIWYNLYAHSDRVADQYYAITTVLGLDVETAQGKMCIIDNKDLVDFGDNHLDMPLRRIRIKD